MLPHEALDTRTIIMLAALFRLSAGFVVISFQSQWLVSNEVRRVQALWGLGNVLIGLGTGAIGLRGIVPDLVSINLGNAGIILGATLTTSAYAVYARRVAFIPIAVVLGGLGVILYNLIAVSDIDVAVQLRSSVTLATLILFEVLIATVLLNSDRPSSQLLRFLIVAHLALIGPLFLRLLELHMTTATEVLASATGVWAAFLGSAVFSFAVTPAFILLLKEDSDRSILMHEKRLLRQEAIAHAKRIKEREELRREQSDQLATLARGLAHDFNHLLSIIRFSIETQRAGTSGDATRNEKHAFQDEVEIAIDQGLALTEGLMNLGKRDLNLAATDISEVLHKARRLVAPSITSDIRQTFDVAPGLIAHSHGSLLLMAVLNIIWNARDAMPAGGELTVRARNRRLEALPQLRIGSVSLGEYTEIAIEDTGHGMDEETISSIFTTDFSKGHGRIGSGLGLYVVRRLVEETMCGLEVTSAPGKGTRFTFYLPGKPAAPTASSSA